MYNNNEYDISRLETLFDNVPYGIYIIDKHGIYVYVNLSYVNALGMNKKDLLYTDVHDFVKRGEIERCISDIVIKEKRRVSVIQDVINIDGLSKTSFKQLLHSVPVFDEKGEVEYVVATCTPLDRINELYEEASQGLKEFVKRIKNPNSVSVIAESEKMKALLAMAKTVAQTDTSVLVTGESGTGKEVITQYIYENSMRADKPLIVVNCASLPENLLEAELFGYEKGAFTGASATGKKGLMEEADGGTLFLDEINSLPLSLQGKLLRALEMKTIQRVGSTKTINVDFRLIAATNEDLEKAVEEKNFRLDLYYRINVLPLYIPPLRERKQDIRPLVQLFLEQYAARYGKKKIFSEGTLKSIEEYSWPGNVRELKNFVERTIIMTTGVIINLDNIEDFTVSYGKNRIEKTLMNIEEEKKHQKSSSHFDNAPPLKDYVEQCEREYIEYVLSKSRSTYEAAKLLGTSQSAIMRKKQKYKIK